MSADWGQKEYKKLKENGYIKLSEYNYGRIVVADCYGANCVVIIVNIYRIDDSVNFEMLSRSGVKLVYTCKDLSQILENEKKMISKFLKFLSKK